MKKILKEYYEQLYVNTFHTMDETEKFLESKLLKLTEEELDNLNSSILLKKLSPQFKILPYKETSGINVFTVRFY